VSASTFPFDASATRGECCSLIVWEASMITVTRRTSGGSPLSPHRVKYY